MGCWGVAPWDDDTAADWFGDLMDSTGLAKKVEEALQQDVDEETAVEIRAAASIVVMMGRIYIWPIDEYNKHLELAATKLEKILEVYPFDEHAGLRDQVTNEIKILRSRLTKSARPDDLALQKWWTMWM